LAQALISNGQCKTLYDFLKRELSSLSSMPLLLALLLGALAEGTCASRDSEDNVCLLALNSTRSTLEANANITAAASSDFHNSTDLSLAGGNLQNGLGATLGTLVSDYRERSARSRLATEADASAAGARAERGQRNGSANAPGTPAEETNLSPITVSDEFKKRLQSSAGKAGQNNMGATPKVSPLKNDTLQGRVLPYGKMNASKRYEKNEAADIMYMRKQQMFPEVNSAPGDTAPTKLTSSASELQTVLEAMYNLGRLIKRMPDDRLETRKESPAPTPPPYAFARRFEPFGEGKSTI